MSIKLAAGAVCGISSGGSSYAGTPVTVTLNNANTHAGYYSSYLVLPPSL